MNKKQLTEFVPLSIFLISAVFALFKIKIPYIGLIAFISGFLLAMLYFYASFWLYAETVVPIAIKIIAGVLFSLSIVACMYSVLNWPYWRLFDVIGFATLGSLLIICLLNRKSAGYKPILHRCIFFVGLLSLGYAYRQFSA